MGKYESLGRYLHQQKNEKLNLGFDQIEEILGFGLPKSARNYRAWWAEDPRHVQAFDGWLSVGWKVGSVDFSNQIVVFAKNENAEVHVSHDNNQEVPVNLKKDSTNRSPRSMASEFESIGQGIMSQHFSKDLSPGEIDGVRKLFDYVSSDGTVVGDAKYYTLVRGISLPPAKFATIAEHVWLLEKTKAKKKFLVFGNDRRVPEKWLEKYGNLVSGVSFFFIGEEGNLELLQEDE